MHRWYVKALARSHARPNFHLDHALASKSKPMHFPRLNALHFSLVGFTDAEPMVQQRWIPPWVSYLDAPLLKTITISFYVWVLGQDTVLDWERLGEVLLDMQARSPQLSTTIRLGTAPSAIWHATRLQSANRVAEDVERHAEEMQEKGVRLQVELHQYLST